MYEPRTKKVCQTYLWLACTRLDFFFFFGYYSFGHFSVFLYTREAVIPPPMHPILASVIQQAMPGHTAAAIQTDDLLFLHLQFASQTPLLSTTAPKSSPTPHSSINRLTSLISPRWLYCPYFGIRWVISVIFVNAR